MRKTVFLAVLLALIVMLTGCGKNIPAKDIAQYEVYSNQAIGEMLIYTDSYEVVDGVLYLDDYWAYKNGAVFFPTYAHYTSTTAFTNWRVSIRR